MANNRNGMPSGAGKRAGIETFRTVSNGYERSAVDSYVRNLNEENAYLKAKNEKLHKDCVSFAKRLKKIQQSGVLDANVEDLKLENEQYLDEIVRLQEQVARLSRENKELTEALDFDDDEFYEDDEEPQPAAPAAEPAAAAAEPVPEAAPVWTPPAEPFYQPADTEVLDDVYDQPELTEDGLFAEVPAPEGATVPERAPSKTRSRIRTLIAFLLCLTLLSALVSGICSYFATHTDKGFFGIRCATVGRNDVNEVTTDDIVVLKGEELSKLQPNDIVMSTQNDRSLGYVQDIKVEGSETYLIVADDHGSQYNVKNDGYLGKVTHTIKGLAGITVYAVKHTYNFFAILAAISLFLIALLLFIPSGKPRKPKYGRDFTEQDFTI
ncbi:MAG: hypothetical protein IIZ60_07355 [Clostridia bacterium]|nr:hypothetical protein [Clostridia bacterium]